jgi:hypothetical protein
MWLNSRQSRTISKSRRLLGTLPLGSSTVKSDDISHSVAFSSIAAIAVAKRVPILYEHNLGGPFKPPMKKYGSISNTWVILSRNWGLERGGPSIHVYTDSRELPVEF